MLAKYWLQFWKELADFCYGGSFLKELLVKVALSAAAIEFCTSNWTLIYKRYSSRSTATLTLFNEDYKFLNLSFIYIFIATRNITHMMLHLCDIPVSNDF